MDLPLKICSKMDFLKKWGIFSMYFLKMRPILGPIWGLFWVLFFIFFAGAYSKIPHWPPWIPGDDDDNDDDEK